MSGLDHFIFYFMQRFSGHIFPPNLAFQVGRVKVEIGRVTDGRYNVVLNFEQLTRGFLLEHA